MTRTKSISSRADKIISELENQADKNSARLDQIVSNDIRYITSLADRESTIAAEGIKYRIDTYTKSIDIVIDIFKHFSTVAGSFYIASLTYPPLFSTRMLLQNLTIDLGLALLFVVLIRIIIVFVTVRKYKKNEESIRNSLNEDRKNILTDTLTNLNEVGSNLSLTRSRTLELQSKLLKSKKKKSR